ncbi:hypothetical protein GA0004736_3420 [Curtobacterium sp. 9128]|uniref:hypothetical protein n=1 Tax=Curtobacterium sp. 9128 TaxID=1793722 RepID=UPI0007D7348F|nr:hypothetical protein [Curtobacterium sp. 9128]SBN64460.1 hypothetical protein GA0004736_3420 [Curtobacterium sp. 9128]
MTDTEVGGIKGFLSLDDSAWDRTIAKAKADVRQLSTMDANVHIDANTARAEERIAVLHAAVRALGAESVTVDVKVIERAGGGSSAATRAAATTQAQLAEAQEKSAIATMKADLAQQRLTDAEEKGGAAAAELMAKRIALAEAQNRESAAMDRAVTLTRELNEARAREAAAATAAAAGETELAAATREAAVAADSSGKSYQAGSSRVGLMAAGITALVATVGPLTGTLVAAGGAALGMGAAGVLAVFGIKKAMDDGTYAGQAYSAGLQALRGDLDSLGATSAGAMLEHFQTAEQTITNDMPALRSQVAGFSDSLGQAGNSILTGLVKGFQVANPLMQQGQQLIVRVADGFERWASGSGLATFAAEASHDLPIVVRGVGDLASGAVALLGSLRPVGLVVVQVAGGIGELAQFAAQAGPLLPILGSGAAAVWLGFKAWDGIRALTSGAQAGITALSASMDALMGATTRSAASTAGQAAAQGAVAATAPAAAAGEAAVAEGAAAMNATMAANPIGIVVGLLAGLAAITLVAANATQTNTEATTDYTAALEQDGDAIGAHTAKMAAKALQDAKVVGTAKQYGLTLSDLTKSVTGNGDAQTKVNGVLDTQIEKYEEQARAARMGSTGQSAAAKIASEHVDALKKLQSELDSQTNAVKRNKKEQDDANSASHAATDAIKSNASAYGMTTGAYQTASDAAKKQAAATRESTREMQLASDAAGLLTNALTLLNGGALSVAQAQTGVASAVNQAEQSFKDNGAAIEGNSEAAVANQQAIQGQVQAAQQMAEAQSKATGSTTAGVEAYKQSKTALEDALRAQGNLTPAVQDYINRLYDVDNLKVKPTKLDVDKAAADAALDALKAHIASVPNKHDTKTDALIADAQAKLDSLKGSISSVPANKQTEMKAAIATAQANLNAIKSSIAQIPTSKTITITTNHVNVADGTAGNGLGVMANNGRAHGGTIGRAHGGTIASDAAQRFAGGGTSGGTVSGGAGSFFSDSLTTRLSIGEEVVQKQAAAYPGARAIIQAINAKPAETVGAIMQPKSAQQAPVNVYISGAGLRDVIQVEIEQAGRRRKASLQAGRRSQ